MGCMGSKQKEQTVEGDEPAQGDAPNRNSVHKPLIEDDKGSVGIDEDLPFIDENGVDTPDPKKKLADGEIPAEHRAKAATEGTAAADELPDRDSIIINEETKDSENVQIIKESGDGVEHERIIVTKQVKVVRDEIQFIKPGEPIPSAEEKREVETETIRERHVITKRVVQIDGEDVPGTETTKEEITREVVINEEKEEIIEQNPENKYTTEEEEEDVVVLNSQPEEEAQPAEESENKDNIEVKIVDVEEGSSPEPLSEDQVALHMKSQQEEVLVNGINDDHHSTSTSATDGKPTQNGIEDDQISAVKAAARTSAIDGQVTAQN